MSDSNLPANNNSNLPETTGRNVYIYNNQDINKNGVITTTALTFGELKRELSARGMPTNSQSNSFINGNDKTSYQLDEASLPDGDFTLFIYPLKTKSGMKKDDIKVLDYKGLAGIIKTCIADDPDSKEKYFTTNEGKSWSRAGKEERMDMVLSYFGHKSKIVKKKTTSKKTANKKTVKKEPVKKFNFKSTLTELIINSPDETLSQQLADVLREYKLKYDNLTASEQKKLMQDEGLKRKAAAIAKSFANSGIKLK